MSDLIRFAGQCLSLPAELEAARRSGAQKGALGLTTTVRRNTQRVAPGGRVNVGKRGARVGARFDRAPSGDYLVKATGPYQLIERDTSAHTQPRPRRKRKVLLIPGVGYRRSVRHPGTKGRHPFEKAVREYGPQVPKVVAREIRDAMGRAFS
jgi:hypothetical protein